MEIGLLHYLLLGALLFTIGMCGMFLNRKNVITLLMSIELMLLGVNVNFIAFSAFLQHDIAGQIFTLFILSVAAAEAAVGLAILVLYFRHRHSIEVAHMQRLKG